MDLNQMQWDTIILSSFDVLQYSVLKPAQEAKSNYLYMQKRNNKAVDKNKIITKTTLVGSIK